MDYRIIVVDSQAGVHIRSTNNAAWSDVCGERPSSSVRAVQPADYNISEISSNQSILKKPTAFGGLLCYLVNKLGNSLFDVPNCSIASDHTPEHAPDEDANEFRARKLAPGDHSHRHP
jgi:hypothetical protein